MEDDKKYDYVEINGKKVLCEVGEDGTYRKCDDSAATNDNETDGDEKFYQNPYKKDGENGKHFFGFKKDKNAWEYFPCASFCILLYLCLGCIWNLWHPGWIIFLLVPMVVGVLQHGLRGFPYPIFVLAIYLLMGFVWNLWHPGWLIFLTIPIYYTILSSKSFPAFLHALYPLLCIAAFLVLGFGWNLWHPGWLVFLTIPVFNGFAEMVRHAKKK